MTSFYAQGLAVKIEDLEIPDVMKIINTCDTLEIFRVIREGTNLRKYESKEVLSAALYGKFPKRGELEAGACIARFPHVVFKESQLHVEKGLAKEKLIFKKIEIAPIAESSE